MAKPVALWLTQQPLDKDNILWLSQRTKWTQTVSYDYPSSHMGQ